MVFVHASSLEGSAVALLFVGNASQYRSFGGLGFHLVKKASEENSDGDFCPRLQAELQAAFQALVQRKDDKGRTLLHYIAASSTKVNEHEMRERA